MFQNDAYETYFKNPWLPYITTKYPFVLSWPVVRSIAQEEEIIVHPIPDPRGHLGDYHSIDGGGISGRNRARHLVQHHSRRYDDHVIRRLSTQKTAH